MIIGFALQISGKIVVFNKEYGSFEEGKRYRLEGTAKAAEKGAVAALIRSVTDDAPHAGRLSYNADGPKIPGFSITVEDAKLMSRKQERGNFREGVGTGA